MTSSQILVPSLLFFAVIIACGPPVEGPGDIVFGRDVCERCQMVISDGPDAVQIRSAHDHRLRHFDDLGCAVLWQAEQAGAGHAIEEIWVVAPDGSGWRDGRGVRYADGHATPMNHGFRVAGTTEAPAVGFETVQRRIVERERERRSARR